jgi:protein-tyrosine phosphatase
VLQAALSSNPALSSQVKVTSSGITGHKGWEPDDRTVAAAAKRGYKMSHLRGKMLQSKDFAEQDLLLALDRGHLTRMQHMCPAEHKHKVVLLMDMAKGSGSGFVGKDVPDPYYDGEEAFELVLDMIEDVTPHLVRHIATVLAESE